MSIIKTILVISKYKNLILERLLLKKGYKVLSFTLKDERKLIFNEKIDLIVIDLFLPLEIIKNYAKELNEKYNVPIVVSTNYLNDDVKPLAIQLDINLLKKDYENKNYIINKKIKKYRKK